MRRIQALFIGEKSLCQFHNPAIDWKILSAEELRKYRPRKQETYDLTILWNEVSEEVVRRFDTAIAPYTLFYLDAGLASSPSTKELIESKAGRLLTREECQNLLQDAELRFWRGQYGEKIGIDRVEVRHSFAGKVSFKGHNFVELEGYFGHEFRPILNWKYGTAIQEREPHELWLEFEKDNLVELLLKIRLRASGTNIIVREYDVTDFQNPTEVLLEEGSGAISLSLWARGNGRLNIGPCHDRLSRKGQGQILVGGERRVDQKRQEIFSYFYPGDRKPPLNVYFSGYHDAETFEGYYMMREIGAPFLLLSDNRIEGGSYYMGSAEYEENVQNIIGETLKLLGFGPDELVLSGISMGTTGALYYGAKLQPHALILGKPLINLGNVAKGEKTIRPGGWETSLDIVGGLTGTFTNEGADQLTDKMWETFRQADFSQTSFAVSYMKQDDYDPTAYGDLVRDLTERDVHIYGKGMTGRHNDNTEGVVEWFQSQYRRMMAEDFGREE